MHAFIVGGARTPFARAFAELIELDTIALGVVAVQGALRRLSLPASAVDALVWGGVILPPGSPNIGREIALDAGLPPSVEAMTVSRACASGLQAIADGVAKIERGEADVVIAGGSDSTSNAALTMPESLVRKAGPVAMKRGAGPLDWIKLATRLSSRDLLPRKPRVAERSTGELMGEAAEKMATRNLIGRAEQDAFALRSHLRAAAAAGRFPEIVPVDLPGGGRLEADTLVRSDTTLERLSALRPAFAREGTVTAGNATALTDGAACVVLMSERAARSHGQRMLAGFRSFAWVGVDPADQLLMGPALAMPRALERAGLSLAEIDRVELHEAFAAQVLSVLQMLESDAFARERLGREVAVGRIDTERLNVHGGSLALGHPFAATGARIALTLAHELDRTDARTGLIGICAAGGLGAAAVMEAGPKV